jgi:hypothetical protein
MREFDDLDILLRNTLTAEADVAHPSSVRVLRSLRAGIKQRHGKRLRTRLCDLYHVTLDAMLLRGTNEPIYRVPLEGRLLSLLCFIR